MKSICSGLETLLRPLLSGCVGFCVGAVLSALNWHVTVLLSSDLAHDLHILLFAPFELFVALLEHMVPGVSGLKIHVLQCPSLQYAMIGAFASWAIQGGALRAFTVVALVIHDVSAGLMLFLRVREVSDGDVSLVRAVGLVVAIAFVGIVQFGVLKIGRRAWQRHGTRDGYLQYSLQSALTVTVLVALCAGYVATLRNRVREETKLIAGIPNASTSYENGYIVHVQIGTEAERTVLGCQELANLARLKRLKRLELEYCDLDASGFDRLSSTTKMCDLAIRSCSMGAEGWRSLPRFGNLKSLELWSVNMSDGDVLQLGKCRSLTRLTIRERRVNPVMWTVIGDLIALTTLDLSSSSVDDGIGSSLHRLHSLRTLSLAGTCVGDQVCGNIGGLAWLEELDLRWTNVGDRGIERLASSPRLRVLKLSATKVTDCAAKSLVRLPAIEEVHVGHTRVSCDFVERIERQRPDVRVFAEDTAEPLF